MASKGKLYYRQYALLGIQRDTLLSVFLFAALLECEISVSFLWLSLPGSFRVDEENLVFETVQSGPYFSFKCFLCS